MSFLLGFANLSYEFRAQQAYIDFGLDKFDVHYSTVPLIESLVNVDTVMAGEEFIEEEDKIPTYMSKKGNNPFKAALKRIKPARAG